MTVTLCKIAREFDACYESDLNTLEKRVVSHLREASVVEIRDGVICAKYRENAPNSWVLREEYQV